MQHSALCAMLLTQTKQTHKEGYVMQNKYTTLKAQLLAIVEAAEDAYDVTDEDEAADASNEYALLLEEIVQLYEAADFDTQSIVQNAL